MELTVYEQMFCPHCMKVKKAVIMFNTFYSDIDDFISTNEYSYAFDSKSKMLEFFRDETGSLKLPLIIVDNDTTIISPLTTEHFYELLKNLKR